jgi:hypothetical protein
MAFNFPSGLNQELFPLAWLLGTWEGTGQVSYHEQVPTSRAWNQITFTHDGGTYLQYESVIKILGEGEAEIPGVKQSSSSISGLVELGDTQEQAIEAVVNDTQPDAAEVWSRETGFWRISPLRDGSMQASEYFLDVFMADGGGRLTYFNGEASPARIQLASAKMIRAQLAAEVNGSKRMYGFVDGQLAWAEDLVAFGHELSNYSSFLLTRTVDGDGNPIS